MVDEAKKALEKAEALKKVCIFFVINFLFGFHLRVTSDFIECGGVFFNSIDIWISFCLVLDKLLEVLDMLYI